MIEGNQLNKVSRLAWQGSLETLLDFFTYQENHSSKEQFFEELDEFLAVSFHALPLMIAATKKTESYRLVWNESVLGDEYPSRDLLVLNTFLLENYRKGNDAYYAEDGYYIFSLGEDLKQRYWAFFKIPRKNLMTSKLFDYFVRLSQKSFRYMVDVTNAQNSQELIFCDDVTGLYNHRRLRFDLDKLINNFHQNCEVFSVLFVDIDHFKNVNDGNGHLVGTELLRQLSNVIGKTVCESNLLYRYGGDEFVVLLPKIAALEAKIVGERVLREVKSHHFEVRGKAFNISVSIGVSCFPKDARSSDEIIDVADKMMYQAKKQGRGRVSLTSELVD